MRHFVILLFISGLLARPACAQFSDLPAEVPCPLKMPTALVAVTPVTRSLGETLHLTDGQYTRLHQLYLTLLARQDEVLWLFDTDPVQLQLQRQLLSDFYRQQCQKILRPDQANQLLQPLNTVEAQLTDLENKLG